MWVCVTGTARRGATARGGNIRTWNNFAVPDIRAETQADRDLRRELRRGIRGEVHVDRVSRGLYSTDASLYQIDPVAVVVPRDRAEIEHALGVARKHELRVLPRGGGTSLAGQSAGECMILDTSKYMNQVIEWDVAGRWVRVEPGRVRDELNDILLPTGLHFAPETATSNRANIGGMIGNNSSGTKSIYYGKTVDHVLELDILLATGEAMHLAPMSQTEWEKAAQKETREGEIYRRVREIIQANRSEIEKRYPKVMRRVGGYNLDAFPETGDWNLAHLIVGSEGTLATVLEAKLNLEPIPPAKGVCVVHFDQLGQALRTVERIVAHGPSAVEILDATVIGLSRQNLETQRICGWIEGDPAAVLIVEFFAESETEIVAKIDALTAELQAEKLGYAHPRMLDAAAQAQVWGVRAAGLGLMLGMKGDAKPMAFIEDSAVPLAHLPDYIEEVLEVCRSLEVPVAMYAHASVGLIHVRPILDLKRSEDIENMKEISERTFELVRKYGGSWSGEHGDGLVRSYMNERFFGEQLYGAFREIKALFDPDGMMNPGKIVDSPAMDRDLRYGEDYRPTPPATHYHYREDGGFERAVEMCTGVGACRKTLGGTMCPSYIATRDEEHSTRGRANVLRLAMTGQLGPGAIAGDSVRAVYDLCLGCKGCKAECPSNVDVARLKSEVLSLHHDKHGATLGEKFFAHAPDLGRWIAGPMAGVTAPVANWFARQTPIRSLLESRAGIDRRRPLPQHTSQPFPKWFESREPKAPKQKRVVLFDDTFMNQHEPQVGRAAVEVLEQLGYSVTLANAGCCCRPLISKGFLSEAKTRGLEVLKKLDVFLAQGLAVVVCEPSCWSALTDDLPDLIEDRALGDRVKQGVKPIDIFLAEELAEGRIEKKSAAQNDASRGQAPVLAPALAPALLHGHCHQKALYGTDAMKTLLRELGGMDLEEIDSGCCGMAGSFGYEKEHYDLSMQVAEDRLFPAIRKKSAKTALIAPGFSCRHQISDGLGVCAKSFVEVLRERLGATDR